MLADVLLCLDTWRVPLTDELELVECSETTELGFFVAAVEAATPRVVFAGTFPFGSIDSLDCLAVVGPACEALRTFCA